MSSLISDQQRPIADFLYGNCTHAHSTDTRKTHISGAMEGGVLCLCVVGLRRDVIVQVLYVCVCVQSYSAAANGLHFAQKLKRAPSAQYNSSMQATHGRLHISEADTLLGVICMIVVPLLVEH